MTPDVASTAAPFTLRELRWSDLESLRETYYLLYDERETNPEIGITLFATRPSPADEVAWFAQLYRAVLAGDAVCVVADVDGRSVGSCTVRRAAPTAESEGAHVAELGILVHRDYRGHGVGRALLARALRECEGRFETVFLRVFSVNVRARRLYEEFGFVRTGTLPREIRRGNRYFDAEIMFKHLVAAPNR